MENKELMEEIISLPDKLKGNETKFLESKFKLAESKKQFDLWENKEMKIILNSKLKFPNAEMRKVELELKKSESVQVKAIWEKNTKLEREQAELEIEIKYLRRRLNALHSIILLTSGKKHPTN